MNEVYISFVSETMWMFYYNYIYIIIYIYVCVCVCVCVCIIINNTLNNTVKLALTTTFLERSPVLNDHAVVLP